MNLKEFLENNGFKKIDKSLFQNKLKTHFGLQKSNSEIITIKNQKGYEVNNEFQYLNTYPFENSFIETFILKERMKNEYNNKFIAYNKIIFNDDISAITSIMGDKESREDIFVYFDYEKSIMINRLALNDLDYENFDYDYIEHILFYNDKDREEVIKKDTITFILNKGKKEYLTKIIYEILNLWDIFLTEDLYKYKALAFILESLLNCEIDIDLTKKSYVLLQNIYVSYDHVLTAFKAHAFFDYALIAEYTNIFELVKNDG